MPQYKDFQSLFSPSIIANALNQHWGDFSKEPDLFDEMKRQTDQKNGLNKSREQQALTDRVSKASDLEDAGNLAGQVAKEFGDIDLMKKASDFTGEQGLDKAVKNVAQNAAGKSPGELRDSLYEAFLLQGNLEKALKLKEPNQTKYQVVGKGGRLVSIGADGSVSTVVGSEGGGNGGDLGKYSYSIDPDNGMITTVKRGSKEHADAVAQGASLMDLPTVQKEKQKIDQANTDRINQPGFFSKLISGIEGYVTGDEKPSLIRVPRSQVGR